MDKKSFPFNGSTALDPFETNIRIEQCKLLIAAGFTHIVERDIPLSSDDHPIDDYINKLREHQNT